MGTVPAVVSSIRLPSSTSTSLLSVSFSMIFCRFCSFVVCSIVLSVSEVLTFTPFLFVFVRTFSVLERWWWASSLFLQSPSPSSSLSSSATAAMEMATVPVTSPSCPFRSPRCRKELDIFLLAVVLGVFGVVEVSSIIVGVEKIDYKNEIQRCCNLLLL